jgi:hypothetical protein
VKWPTKAIDKGQLITALGWLAIGMLSFVDRHDPSASSFDHYGWIGCWALSATYFIRAYRRAGAKSQN